MYLLYFQLPLPESITERPVSYLSQRGRPLINDNSNSNSNVKAPSLRGIAISSENNKNNLRTTNNNDYYSSQQNNFRGSNRFRNKLETKEATASSTISPTTASLPPASNRVLPRFGVKSASRVSTTIKTKATTATTTTTETPAISESLISAFNYNNYRTNQGKRPSSISSSPSASASSSPLLPSSSLQTSSSGASVFNNRETINSKQGHINNNLLVRPLLSSINITHNGSDKTSTTARNNQQYLFNRSQSENGERDAGNEEDVINDDDIEYEFDENYDDEYKVENVKVNPISSKSALPLEGAQEDILDEKKNSDTNKLNSFENANRNNEKDIKEEKLQYEEIPEPEDHTIILTDNFYLPKDADNSKIETASSQEVSEDEENFLVNENNNESLPLEIVGSSSSTASTTTTISETPQPPLPPTSSAPAQIAASTPDFDEEEEYEYEEYYDETLDAGPTNATLNEEEQTNSTLTTPRVIAEQELETTAMSQEPTKLISKSEDDEIGLLINDASYDIDSVTDKILGQSVVTVVTTRSVVNGTPSSAEEDKENSTTESYVVVASVQTSRSISGAHFLPFPQVEQEEKKQALAELEAKLLESNTSNSNEKNNSDNLELTTVDSDILTETVIPTTTTTTTEKSAQTLISTESIIDKLDRVQSELSSGVLTGKFPVLQELTTEGATIQPPKATSKPSVVIRKFMPKTTTVKTTTLKAAPRTTSTTTPATTTKKTVSNKKINLEDNDSDDISSLLPPGFKFRNNYKLKKIITTTSEAPPVSGNSHDLLGEEPMKPEVLRQRNATISRSFKNGGVAQQDLAGFLPKGYRSNSTSTIVESQQTADILSKIKIQNDLEKLLPADYKAKSPNTTKSLIDKVQTVDISAFLPPGFKLNASDDKETSNKKVIPIAEDISKYLPPGYKGSEVESSTVAPTIVVKDDISKYLPSGFKLEDSKADDSDPDDLKNDILKKVQFADVSDLLPPGFKLNATPEVIPLPTSPPRSTSTTPASFKVVFPSRPGFAKKPGVGRATTPKSHVAEGPTPPEISIRKGPPTR